MSQTSGVQASTPHSKDIHNGPKLGRKSPSVCRAGVCGFALAGGTTFRQPAPLPQLPPLAAGAVLRGKEAFPVSPPPNFPAFLASPENRLRAQGGGWAATRLSP